MQHMQQQLSIDCQRRCWTSKYGAHVPAIAVFCRMLRGRLYKALPLSLQLVVRDHTVTCT